MSDRRAASALAVCCTMGLAVSTTLGMSYDTRHSSHGGFHLIAVRDTLGVVAGFVRPRRTVVVVIDGLGHIEAEHMGSLGRLAAQGQCRTTDVGSLSVSRPVFAVLSTGLEQDRTGARGNDDTSPLHAESIWDVAHDAGLRVSGVSELPWWRELFPRAFDEYVIAPRESDAFRLVPPGDVQLVHPVYVDEVGHEHGAASSAYGRAVSRVDGELAGMLDTLDLERDLVVVTADHGHSLRGGHGGRQDRIARVLTCYAGRGVRALHERGAMRATTLAPSIALLLGLRFPAHLRAGSDDLDTMFSIADPDAFPPGYLDERRATIERFRDENRAQLARWLPSSEGHWERFHDAHRASQLVGATPCFALIVVVMLLQARRHVRRGGARAAAFGSLFVLATYFALYATQRIVRGSFDLSSVASGGEFVAFTILMALGWSALALLLHARARRDMDALLDDWMALSVVGTLLSLAHPAAFGWRVGYPAPPAELQFFPYFATLTLGAVQVVGALLAAFVARRSGRASSTT